MNELVQTGVEITTQKRDLSKEMNQLAKERAREIGLKKKHEAPKAAPKAYIHFFQFITAIGYSTKIIRSDL